MTRKIGPDAFDYYLSLGLQRSYQAVAKYYGAGKRAVTKLAAKEGWRARLSSIEAKARERSDSKAVDTLEAMQSKHLKTLSFALGRALEGLRLQPLTNPMDCIRTIDMVLKQERLVRAGPAGEVTQKDNAREYAENVRQAMREMEELHGEAPPRDEGGPAAA